MRELILVSDIIVFKFQYLSHVIECPEDFLVVRCGFNVFGFRHAKSLLRHGRWLLLWNV